MLAISLAFFWNEQHRNLENSDTSKIAIFSWDYDFIVLIIWSENASKHLRKILSLEHQNDLSYAFSKVRLVCSGMVWGCCRCRASTKNLCRGVQPSAGKRSLPNPRRGNPPHLHTRNRKIATHPCFLK